MTFINVLQQINENMDINQEEIIQGMFRRR